MNKKILVTIILGIFLIGFASASLGTFSQNQCVVIKTILNTSEVNISTISYPNGTTAISNKEMTKVARTFNYTFCDTNSLGTYNYDYFDAEGNTYVNSFEITPSGSSGLSNIIFFVFVTLLLYGLNIIAFRDENAPLTILSGMALIFLGIYLVNNGIIIYRDNLTNYIAYVTIGWGLISSMFAVWNEYLSNF